MTIRNSMAHMQYGNFFSQENGTLILYWLYNKDDGIRKDSGIVFEFVLHELIQRFFNNYSSGLLFKNSFFSKIFFAITEEKFLGNIISMKLHLEYVMKTHIMDTIKG